MLIKNQRYCGFYIDKAEAEAQTTNGTESAALTEAQRSGRGIGIENTRKRLEALCGGSLKITAGNGGTKAVILIPVSERGK